jgi:hypothetical protein
MEIPRTENPSGRGTKREDSQSLLDYAELMNSQQTDTIK